MAGGIHLNSIRSLEDLALALSVFASDCRETVAAAQADISRCVSILEDRCREKLLAIQSLQYDYENLDEDEDEDDERSSLRYEIMLAEEAYERARASLRSAENAAFEFARAASRAREVADYRIPEACAFLRQKVWELNEYIATQPGGGGVAGVASAAREAQAKVSLTDFALPSGFRWVRLDEIEPRELAGLPSASDFIKVPYEVMKAGLGVLKDKILPALGETGGRADREYFRGLDGEGEGGVLEVFDAFFRRDFNKHPRVERFAGNRHYVIKNGHHRMKVAMDLGWDAIPAEVVEVEREE